jgi:hypothetical protein
MDDRGVSHERGDATSFQGVAARDEALRTVRAQPFSDG